MQRSRFRSNSRVYRKAAFRLEIEIIEKIDSFCSGVPLASPFTLFNCKSLVGKDIKMDRAEVLCLLRLAGTVRRRSHIRTFRPTGWRPAEGCAPGKECG